MKFSLIKEYVAFRVNIKQWKKRIKIKHSEKDNQSKYQLKNLVNAMLLETEESPLD